MNKLAVVLSGVAITLLGTAAEAQAQSWGYAPQHARGHRFAPAPAPVYVPPAVQPAPVYPRPMVTPAPVYPQPGPQAWRGPINPHEATRMQQVQLRIQHMQMHAQRDGYVDPHEAQRIQRAQQMARWQARRFMFNGR